MFAQNEIGISIQEEAASEHLNTALDIRFNYPDSAEKLFEQSYNEFMNEKDSGNAIYSQVGLSAHYAHNGNYVKAYDGYWEALIVADLLNDQRARATVLNGLGWLYSLFERKGVAENYFNESLSMFKSLNPKTDEINQAILDNYYALATLFRKDNQNELARLYLDSCMIIRTVFNQYDPGPFIEVERAYTLYNEKKYESALEILDTYESYFNESSPSYLVILLSSKADIHRALSSLRKAEYLYLKSLQIGDRYKSHQDIVPGIHERLAQLYVEMGEADKAYQYLLNSKRLNELQFGSKSQNNQRLLEIKDDFRIVKQEQDRQIQE
ncbi:MAG: tetratricopeptide repeat protein, partial [Bacteroidota bacterium]